MGNLKYINQNVGIEIEETGFHNRVTRLTRDTLASNTSANTDFVFFCCLHNYTNN